MRDQRKKCFSLYSSGMIEPWDYVETVAEIKKELKKKVRKLRIERDKKIDVRSGGLYGDLVRGYHPKENTIDMKIIAEAFRDMPKQAVIRFKTGLDIILAEENGEQVQYSGF